MIELGCRGETARKTEGRIFYAVSRRANSFKGFEARATC